MSSPFSKPSEFGGGSFFKPGDHMNDLAILVEPTKVNKDVPNTYNGVTKNRDEAFGRFTFFATQESLDNGIPTEIVEDAKSVHGMLTSTMERVIGGAIVAIVRKIPTKAGSGYAFRDVEADVEAKVAAYYTAREAKVAEALADVPDFD